MAKSMAKVKEKSLPDKVKQFFGFKVSSPPNFDHLRTEPYDIGIDIFKDILPENPVPIRLKALNELCEIVLTKHLRDNAIESLYSKTEDLLEIQHTTETRHIVFQFYCYVLQGQLQKMTIMRSVFFNLIKNHKNPEDASRRLELLRYLSDNGKNITYFEQEIGLFLLEWLPQLFNQGKAPEFLSILINIIKYNSAYLDEDVVSGYIELVCAHCGRTAVEEDLKYCLETMDAVLCYIHLPSKVLQHFIFALCLTVCVEKFSMHSWKLMRNLLGTSLGHTSILVLCQMLQNRKNQAVPSVLQGAIFFISMALWGTKRVPSLIHSPSAVLPSFLMALDYNKVIIANEVVLALQRLIKTNGRQLQIMTWHTILAIIERLLKYPKLQHHGPPNNTLAVAVHDLITAVEELNPPCLTDRIYDIIESCVQSRDEESVINLILHRAKHIYPLSVNYQQNITYLLEKFFGTEKRETIQLKVVEVLRKVVVINAQFLEDNAVEQTLLRFMSNVDTVSSLAVRKASVEFLVEIAETCSPKIYFDIIEVIEKVIKRPFEGYGASIRISEDTSDKILFSDVDVAVNGLIKLFEKKLHMLPASHCVKIYDLLVRHVQTHYQHLSSTNIVFSKEIMKIRRMIIEFFLKFRTNFQKQVGIVINNKVEYSVYILCNKREVPDSSLPYQVSSSSPLLAMTTLNFENVFNLLITALKQEKDWILLELLLLELPKLLHNKAIVICGNFNMNSLCTTLCTLVNEKPLNFPQNLFNVPLKFTRTDFQKNVFPVITSLITYHAQLESYIQRMLIRCLETGLVTSSARVCIEGFTLCTLEMQAMMVKLMPAVLNKLSKISATVSVSIAVLEFLSNLIRIPQLYVSFVEDQYRSIFAIALPYTDPDKFNQYTVALAHHVIAMWFLKCRIPFRKEFAKFIIKALQNNVASIIERAASSSSQMKMDASSSSASQDNSTSSIKFIATLHQELLDIGVDLMARFTFGMSSNVPKRSLISDFLLEKGQKCCWLIGNKIVTITTSGCGTKSYKFGLCEKCFSACNGLLEKEEYVENSVPYEDEAPAEVVEDSKAVLRRRHKSAFTQGSSTSKQQDMQSACHTRDDILLHRQRQNSQQRFARRNTSYFPSGTATETFRDYASGSSTVSANEKKNSSNQLCSCWCSGWAEIHIRRPTGNTSWMFKIQNQLFLPTSPPDFPIPAISSLILPQKIGMADLNQDRISESLEQSSELEESDSADIDFKESTNPVSEAQMCPKVRVPLRRTNSSPDMNSGWSNYAGYQGSDPAIDEELGFALTDNPDLFEMEDAPKTRSATIHSQPAPKLTSTKPSSGSVSSKYKSSKNASVETGKLAGGTKSSYPELGEGQFRGRGHTISVMNHSSMKSNVPSKSVGKDMHRSGMNPNFVFLQLYHDSFFGPPTMRPLLIYQTEVNIRSLNSLDYTPPYDTHKIGVIYIDKGQVDNEQAILSNEVGPTRYAQFLRGLGKLVRLKDVDQELNYIGGLDTKGRDGKFGLVWNDDVMRVAFHVSTLMPNLKSEPMRNNKKMHIGNDIVTIVYNNSGEDYNMATIKSQVTTACVIIHPEDYNSNVVTVKLKTEELKETFGHTEAYNVSDAGLPIFVRQIALHASLASLIVNRRQHSVHVSNWLERLRIIKRLRAKVTEEGNKEAQKQNSQCDSFLDDFTNYV